MFTQLSASLGARWFKSFPGAPWDFEPQLTAEAWAKAIALYQQLYKLAPPECINYLWFDAGTRFSQGDIGMFFHWTPYFYLVKNSGYMTGKKSLVMEKFDVAAWPKAPGVRADDQPRRLEPRHSREFDEPGERVEVPEMGDLRGDAKEDGRCGRTSNISSPISAGARSTPTQTSGRSTPTSMSSWR